jgi:hypothetical protein
MVDARTLYLGYENKTRKAIAINGHDVVVLMHGPQRTILEDEKARSFLKEIAQVSEHICGIKTYRWVEMMCGSEGISDSVEIYNKLFDGYHHHA